MAERRLVERYRMGRRLGAGGMGTVWAAYDELLGRDVAIKRIEPGEDVPPDEYATLCARAAREARAAAMLDHPGIITVHDVVRPDGCPWIVMELVEGRSLDQVVAAEGPLPPRRVAEIGGLLLDALTAAHGKGLLHRDVKPANVLLADDGRVILTDFGIAALDGDPALTRTGTLLGSPGFIAPERLRDEPAGPASDLWSLGATLYAAAEGRAPYDHPAPLAALGAVLTGHLPEPVRAGPLTPVLLRLLDQDPATRITAAQTHTALHRVATGADSGLTASPAQPTRPATRPPASPPADSPGVPPGAPPGTPSGAPPGTPPGMPPGVSPGTPSGTPPGTPPGTPSGVPSGTPSGKAPGVPPGTLPGAPPGTPQGAPQGTPSGTPPPERPRAEVVGMPTVEPPGRFVAWVGRRWRDVLAGAVGLAVVGGVSAGVLLREPAPVRSGAGPRPITGVDPCRVLSGRQVRDLLGGAEGERDARSGDCYWDAPKAPAELTISKAETAASDAAARARFAIKRNELLGDAQSARNVRSPWTWPYAGSRDVEVKVVEVTALRPVRGVADEAVSYTERGDPPYDAVVIALRQGNVIMDLRWTGPHATAAGRARRTAASIAAALARRQDRG